MEGNENENASVQNLRYSKGGPKREVHCNTSLSQKVRKIPVAFQFKTFSVIASVA